MKPEKKDPKYQNPERSFDEVLHDLEQEEKEEEQFSHLEEINYDYLPLSTELDNEILMHRDAHFGGDFGIMLEYYRKGGKGINPAFDISSIESLYEIEKQSGENLAPVLLSGVEAEKIARSKEVYKQLRDLYEMSGEKNKYALLIADLILSEEEEVSAAVEAIVAEKTAIVSLLIDLLRSEEFYDPLFPGYGQAPILAAECLGKIGDKRAIISLFEAIGQEDFTSEETVLKALKALGNPAKEFLLRVVNGRPFNQDNEKAALALVHFKEDPEVAKRCVSLLQDSSVRQNPPFATYLILACEGLADPELQKDFLALIEDSGTPSILRIDMKTISKEWKKGKVSKE